MRKPINRPSFVDMEGHKVESLTVLEYAGRGKTGRALWLCRCECGNTTTVAGVLLRNGNTKSCGCRRSLVMKKRTGANNPQFVDLQGRKFGRLTTIEYHGNGYWLCFCECGEKAIIKGTSLTKKHKSTKSCGCLNLQHTAFTPQQAFEVRKLRKNLSYGKLSKIFHVSSATIFRVCNNLGMYGSPPYIDEG